MERPSFRLALFNALSGRCTCGRYKNQRGKVCCGKCPYGHTKTCQRRQS